MYSINRRRNKASKEEKNLLYVSKQREKTATYL
jgi:hypothetical protein